MSLTALRQKRRNTTKSKALRKEATLLKRIERKGWATPVQARDYAQAARAAGKTKAQIRAVFDPSRVKIRTSRRAAYGFTLGVAQ